VYKTYRRSLSAVQSWVCFKGQMSVRYDILFLARLVSDSPPCRKEAGVPLSREVEKPLGI
jgi:hypothetical protein